MTRYFVGIDLHTAIIQVCVLDPSGAVVHEQRFVGDTLADGERVVQALTTWKDGGRFAVEAVGFNRWFVDACRGAGLDVAVVDPGKLGLRMRGQKTDRRDAAEIARRLLLGDIDRHARSYYASDAEYGCRKLLRTRHHLVHTRQDLINQVRAVLRAHRLPSPGTHLYSAPNLALLRALPLSPAELAAAFGALLDSIQAVQSSIRQLGREIEQLVGDQHVAGLLELPSMGAQTAATLVYELGDVRRFDGPRSVTSYAGLAPRVYNSADKSHHGPLTKRGNAHLRFIVGQWAVRLLARDPLVQRWAAPMLRRLHRNKVRMALARRLLVGVYVTLSRGEAFDLHRCLGLQPT